MQGTFEWNCSISVSRKPRTQLGSRKVHIHIEQNIQVALSSVRAESRPHILCSNECLAGFHRSGAFSHVTKFKGRPAGKNDKSLIRKMD